MLAEISELVLSQARSAIDSINRTDINAYQNRKETSEICLSLIQVYESCNLDEISKLSFEAIINKLQDKLCSEELLAHYCSFYYLPTAVCKHDFRKLSSEIFASNVNISCFRCRIFTCSILGIDFDSSTDRYFYTRGEKIVQAVNNFILYPFEFDYSAIIYLVLNYYQALLESRGFPSIADLLTKQIQEMDRLLEKIDGSFLKEVITRDLSLQSFWNATVPASLKYATIQLPERPDSFTDKQRWTLLSLFKTNYDQANEYLHLNFRTILQPSMSHVLTDSLNIRLLCNSVKTTNEIEEKHELIIVDHLENHSVTLPLSYFFKGFNSADKVTITDEDTQVLVSFNDQELRNRVSRCLQNFAPNDIARQVSKPHGPHEISDIDLRFYESNKMKYLCMPFKSGQEIQKATVAVEFAYQLFRPFVNFGSNCIVVFITAKPISQPLEVFIQLLSVQLPNWRIEVIQGGFLAQLLKINGQL